MERSSSNESVRIHSAGQEHSYALPMMPSTSSTDPSSRISIDDLLSLPHDFTSASPREATDAFVPDDWMASVLDDSMSWDSLPQNVCSQLLPDGMDLSTAALAHLASPETLPLAGNDPFLGCKFPSGDAAMDLFDIDQLLDGGVMQNAAANVVPTDGGAANTNNQLRLFEQWLDSIKAVNPVVPTTAGASTATAPAPAGATTLQDSSVPSPPGSPSDSSDGGYSSNGSPPPPPGVRGSPQSSASGDLDLSSTHSITDNLLRCSRDATQVLGESVLQTNGISLSATSPPPAQTPLATPQSQGSPSDDEGFCLEEKEREKMSGPTAFNSESSMFWNSQCRLLTSEEKEVLEAEGLPVPQKLPFTSAEVKAVKVVRRKIKNKLSAFDSRRKKKHYIDGLEKRVKSSSSENSRLQRRVQQLESEKSSLLKQLDAFRRHVTGGLVDAVPRKASPGQFGLMVVALCFVFLLPSMPTHNMVSLFSARTKLAVSQMPTSSPAVTAFDYRLKQHQSRTLLGYSLPTTLPDLEDAQASLDSPMHYRQEAAAAAGGGDPHPGAASSTAAQRNATATVAHVMASALSAINVHSGRVLIERLKAPTAALHVAA